VPSTLVSGLEGAQGSTVGPGNDLYVTESVLGQVSRIDSRTGEKTTVVSGLPIGIWAGFGGGAIDVAFQHGTPYVLVTAVAEDAFGPPPYGVVGIYRVDGPDSFTVIADIGAWSIANPPEPAFFLPTGNQYAIEAFRGGFLVSDGHHNRVLEVSLEGQITEVIAFDNIVPTGLEVRNNTVYVAQAGPIPHLPENGIVVSFPWGDPTATEVASGAPLLVDVEFGPGNTLYALAQGHWDSEFEGDPAEPNTGSLVRVNADGTFTVIEDELNQPTSLEFIGNTAYVVTLTGDVLRFDDVTEPSGISGGARAVHGSATSSDWSAVVEALAAEREKRKG
jgi:hypothetical protein